MCYNVLEVIGLKCLNINMYRFIIPSLLFFALLKSVTENHGLSLETAVLSALIIIATSFLNSPKKHRILPIIILTLVFTSNLMFIFNLKDGYSKNIFLELFSFIFLLALAGINIFFNQRRQQKEKETEIKFPNLGSNLIKSVVLISVFLWAAGSYGLYLNLELSIHLLMLIILINIIFSTRCLLKINFASQKIPAALWFYPFLFGLIMVELVWAISFWPIERLAVGAIILANYYVFWNILESRLKNSLNKKIIFSNILFLAIVIASLLFSSQWEIR